MAETTTITEVNEANMGFVVPDDIKLQTKTQRLQFFARQIAETQLNIKVYDALITQFNLNEDIQARDTEIKRLDRYVISYNIVNQE